MENMGIQKSILWYRFSQLTAEEFVRTVLVNQFDIHKIIIGHDHRFGRDRTANIDDLLVLGNDMGLRSSRYLYKKLMTFNKLNQNQKSDFTRKYASGKWIFRYYFLSGTVFKGKQLVEPLGSPPQT
jgi:riboflavin kinase/FMN adenylyltransferase